MFIAQNSRRVEPLTLSISPTTINWVNGQSGDTQTITINTNGNWRVSRYSEALLTLNKTSGTGNDTIEISLKSNISATTSAAVTITATLGSQTQNATVNISLPVYTLNITGLIGVNEALFNPSEPPVQDASRSFFVNTNWPYWTMNVMSTSNMGSNWSMWIGFDKVNGTSSNNEVTYTMHNSYFKEGIMNVRFTGSDGRGNSQQYNYSWRISGITSIILHMEKNERGYYDAYITDSYYTSPTKLDEARDYEKHGLFYPGSSLLEEDGPTVRLYDEYNIDCSPVYTVSHNEEEGLYYINFAPVADATTFNNPDLGGCGLRYIWVVNPGEGEWIDASLLSRIRLNWDMSGDGSVSIFLRDTVSEASMDKHYYNVGYETEDTINPSGRGAAMSWFTPYTSSNKSYAITRDERRGADNFTKVIAFSSTTSGYVGFNILLVEEWDGSTTSVQLLNEDSLEIPNNYTGLKANVAGTAVEFTASNFEFVRQGQ